MKLSKTELNEKISSYEIDNDLKIELLENINDSFIENDNSDEISQLKEEIENLKNEKEEITNKYIERFTSDIKLPVENLSKNLDDIEEKKYIDIKSI